jgi:hypothetical protein
MILDLAPYREGPWRSAPWQPAHRGLQCGKAVMDWDVKTGELTQRLVGNKDWLTMAYNANGERIASARGDVRIWDVHSAKESRALSDVVRAGPEPFTRKK